MTTIHRIRVAWSGFTGAPGVSTFYSTDPVVTLPALKTMFTTLTAVLPNTVTLTYPSSGDSIDVLDGTLQGTWIASAPAVTLGGVNATYSGPSGAVINWLTGSVVNGHRLRGKTFLVPLTSSAYQTDGSLDNGKVTVIRDAATAFLTNAAGSFVVWARPRPGKAGAMAAATTLTVPDKAAVLRSRRD